MTRSALDVIREIAARKAEDPYEWRIWARSNRATHLFDELKQLPPFDWFNGKLRQPGDGSYGEVMTGIRTWVMSQLMTGKTPEMIIEDVNRTIERNAIESWEVRVVEGVRLSASVQLSDSAFLMRKIDLPPDGQRERTFVSQTTNTQLPEDSAALVHKIAVSPLFSTRMNHFDPRARDERDQFASVVRAALGLLSGGAVEFGSVYFTTPDTTSFMSGNNGSYWRPVAHLIREHHEVDHTKIVDAVATIRAFGQLEPLLLAFDRLLRSRTHLALVDRMIDLGICTEAMLMFQKTGTGDGKSEITHRISSRGAWLLEPDHPELRRPKSKIIKNLYEVRSTAVHTGKINAKKLAASVEEYDAVAVSLLKQLLARGSFPDWESLTFGAGG